jgi:hypothetical protein
MARLYEGKRISGRAAVTVNGTPLAPRNDLMNHSPDGFEWGYGGSGPAQLALAICADSLGDDKRAFRVYQDFKFRMIAPIQTDEWAFTGETVRQAIAEIESKAV